MYFGNGGWSVCVFTCMHMCKCCVHVYMERLRVNPQEVTFLYCMCLSSQPKCNFLLFSYQKLESQAHT